MHKVRISAVSYLNSTPFVYGLEHSDLIHEVELSLDIPAVCAEKLRSGTVQLGLIPVAVIPLLKEFHIISDYCIGAVGKVNSVMLYSDVPLNEIKTVLLDYQSRTSVSLVRVLASEYWKIDPSWEKASEGYIGNIGGSTAAVVIGDRTFGLNEKFRFVYDLADEWQKFSGLPFVFACWVSNTQLPGTFIEKFNSAMKLGLDSRPILIEELISSGKYKTDIAEYLYKSISYDYDAEKKQALQLFLSYLPDGGF
jgi:chorismate dehydratase